MSDEEHIPHEDVSEDFVKDFLDIQKGELRVRMAEIQTTSEELSHEKEIAIQSIQAQVADRESSRMARQNELRSRQKYGLILSGSIFVFILALVFMKESAMAMKMVEILGAGALGAFGGYGFAMTKASKQGSPQDEN